MGAEPRVGDRALPRPRSGTSGSGAVGGENADDAPGPAPTSRSVALFGQRSAQFRSAPRADPSQPTARRRRSGRQSEPDSEGWRFLVAGTLLMAATQQGPQTGMPCGSARRTASRSLGNMSKPTQSSKKSSSTVEEYHISSATLRDHPKSTFAFCNRHSLAEKQSRRFDKTSGPDRTVAYVCHDN